MNDATQFLQMQEKSDLRGEFGRLSKTLPVFRFSGLKHAINLVKVYLLPILADD